MKYENFHHNIGFNDLSFSISMRTSGSLFGKDLYNFEINYSALNIHCKSLA